jgi:hypothetical protein
LEVGEAGALPSAALSAAEIAALATLGSAGRALDRARRMIRSAVAAPLAGVVAALLILAGLRFPSSVT